MTFVPADISPMMRTPPALAFLRLEPPKSEIVKTPLQVENGFLLIPDGPGIGIELADDALERFPERPREVVTRLHVDGSVVDQ